MSWRIDATCSNDEGCAKLFYCVALLCSDKIVIRLRLVFNGAKKTAKKKNWNS